MPNTAVECNDLYFFGEGQMQNNPRHVSILGYEGDCPLFFQFSTILSQTSTQTRVTICFSLYLDTLPIHSIMHLNLDRCIEINEMSRSLIGQPVRKVSCPFQQTRFHSMACRIFFFCLLPAWHVNSSSS